MGIEENRILTLDEVKEQGLWYFYYGNGVYEYKTEDGLMHLIINGVDVLEGKEAVWCHYCGDKVYYETEDGKWHKFQVKLNKYKFSNLLNPWRSLVKKIKIMLDN